jgi:hypothetical protein
MAFKRSGVRSPSAPLYFKSTYGITPVGAFYFVSGFTTILQPFCRWVFAIGREDLLINVYYSVIKGRNRLIM